MNFWLDSVVLQAQRLMTLSVSDFKTALRMTSNTVTVLQYLQNHTEACFHVILHCGRAVRAMLSMGRGFFRGSFGIMMYTHKTHRTHITYHDQKMSDQESMRSVRYIRWGSFPLVSAIGGPWARWKEVHLNQRHVMASTKVSVTATGTVTVKAHRTTLESHAVTMNLFCRFCRSPTTVIKL